MFKIRTLREIPQSPADVGCLIFLLSFVPVSFIFELCIVMPSFHEAGSIMFVLTWLGGVYIVYNIMGNFIACILEDPSIRGLMLKPPLEPQLRKHWRLCSVCELLAPPRSWHCDTCKTCILKRDHHCIFTANCVGHRNQRYFLMFLLHSLIGCAYSCIYNNLFIWWLHNDFFWNLRTAFKLVFPFLGFFMEFSWLNVYLFLYEINLVLFIYIIVLLCFHLPNILKGATTYERNLSHYDLGWKKNIEMFLGKRWYLVWLSPFLNSPLPHDGIHWENVLKQTTKNR
ncbi:probable palmitoyltransferase ZDHHC24 [Lucilia cuprina]|uniref:probable palmitoyltransferase ZDHHC24 n=1 Tax=Lucilia cuprina TaxID=7375 RepID=UPI001F06883C|nr:probable palmitoyltransferase ZDHHC24 [Lucilia cuprina]